MPKRPRPSDLKEQCVAFVQQKRQEFQLFAVAQNRLDLLQWNWDGADLERNTGEQILQLNRQEILRWCLTWVSHSVLVQWLRGCIDRKHTMQELQKHVCFTHVITLVKHVDCANIVQVAVRARALTWVQSLLDIHHVSVRSSLRFPEGRALFTGHSETRVSDDCEIVLCLLRHKCKPYITEWYRDAIERMIDWTPDGCSWNEQTAVPVLRALLEYNASTLLDPKSIVEIPLQQYPILSTLFKKATSECTMTCLEKELVFPTVLCQMILDYARMDFFTWAGIVYTKFPNETEDFCVIHASGVRCFGDSFLQHLNRQSTTITHLDAVPKCHLWRDLKYCYRAWKRHCLPPDMLTIPITSDILEVTEPKHLNLSGFPTYGALFLYCQEMEVDFEGLGSPD